MAAKKRRKRARKTTKRRSTKKRARKAKGHVPLPILERRLKRLASIVAKRRK